MWFAIYFTGIIASLVASVFFSITARQRDLHPLASRMTLGKMNISIGVLVTLFGINQFTFDEITTVRAVVGALLLLLGVVNLLQGTRNYLRYRREWRTVKHSS